MREKVKEREREILSMKEMVVIYAGLCDSDDAEIVYWPYLWRVIPASCSLVTSNILQQ